MLVKKLKLLAPGRFRLIGFLSLSARLLVAQQPIGRTSATEVQVSGAVDISHGETRLGNGSEITAGNQAVKITLERGGSLRLCSTSSVHLSKDRSVADPASSALMMALDRGAIEANYTVGTYSDVLLTPDLRILISGPGEADLRIRVNPKGDTCVDNHGANAPYVTVTSQLEGGAYRVRRINASTSSTAACAKWLITNRSLAVAQRFPSLLWPVPGPRQRTPRRQGGLSAALPRRLRIRLSPLQRARDSLRLPLHAPRRWFLPEKRMPK